MADEIDWTESYKKYPVYKLTIGEDTLINRRVPSRNLQEAKLHYEPIPVQTEESAVIEAEHAARLSNRRNRELPTREADEGPAPP